MKETGTSQSGRDFKAFKKKSQVHTQLCFHCANTKYGHNFATKIVSGVSDKIKHVNISWCTSDEMKSTVPNMPYKSFTL